MARRVTNGSAWNVAYILVQAPLVTPEGPILLSEMCFILFVFDAEHSRRAPKMTAKIHQNVRCVG